MIKKFLMVFVVMMFVVASCGDSGNGKDETIDKDQENTDEDTGVADEDSEDTDDSPDKSNEENDETGENGEDNPDLIDECDIDIEIRSKKDLDSILNCRVITGELIIEETELEEIFLPHLEEVWDRFDIWDNPKLKKLLLPKLREAGPGFFIDMNPLLEKVDLKNLKEVTHAFSVSMNDSLKELALPELDKIWWGDIYIMFNESLELFDVPKLQELDEHLFIYKNNSLKSFSLPKLDGALFLYITRNGVLETFDLSSFVDSQEIVIAYNTLLPTELAEELVKRVKENNKYFDEEDYEVCENKDSTVKCYDDYDWDWEDM